MTDTGWQTVNGTIAHGHQVASGAAADSPYPEGTIALQAPFFQQLGLDLTGFFLGTLNVSISPNRFQVVQPEFTFRSVEWTDRHPPEDFSFSQCRVNFNGVQYPCFIYYPHPETKQRHFQDPAILEIIAPLIPGIGYGSAIQIEYNPFEIVVQLE